MNSLRPSVFAIAAFSILSAAPAASGATWYVGDAGVDGSSCGLTATTPCRSISQAIELAAPGDTILVGPGRYSGDLNANGFIGEAGEEQGDGACMLRVNKPVIIASSGGAAATMIDGATANPADATVCVTAAGAHFGTQGKGFTVTETVKAATVGIRIDSAGGVTVRGNHVTVFRSDLFLSGVGILAVENDAPHLIEGNSVTHRGTGIDSLGAATTVSRNQVAVNGTGIQGGGQIISNVAMSNNGLGIAGWPTATITNNAVWLNLYGIVVAEAFTGAISKNNLFANIACGLRNIGRIGLSASNNYWGAPSGPGAPPADSVCNEAGGTTIVSPVAKKPFAVKVLKP